MGQKWLARLQLISERQKVQGDTNYKLLNIQTVSQAEYPFQDDKQKQLPARQSKRFQTKGRYLTQSTAIQGQSVRQLDESLPCEAASITSLPGGLLNNVVQSINTYSIHMSSTDAFLYLRHALCWLAGRTLFYQTVAYLMKGWIKTKHDLIFDP